MFLAMGKLFFVLNLIWVMIVLAQMNAYRGCVEKERKGLMELKAFLNSISDEPDEGLRHWTKDTKSDCCHWEYINCNLTSGHVIELELGGLFSSRNLSGLLNLSLLYPFEELQSLDLSSIWFGGWFDDMEGYKSLGRLRKLKTLYLSYGGYNNSILPFLNSAASLKTLDLSENNMNGPFPIKELKNLRNLQALDLSGNNFEGPLPRSGICKLKNLQELDLSQNKFVGQLPLRFCSFTKLRVLDLSSNQFSGKLPSFINSLESLEYLSLSDNNFEGLFSLTPLTNLSKLKVFKLSSESNLQLMETESSWQPKFQLSVIALTYCNLEEIPSFLADQKELRLIDLSNNRLSGVFPSWLLECNPELEVLFFQNNSFTTFQLPGIMHGLLLMDVSANDFDHQLPENIGRILFNLRHLNLSRNGFQGNLPSSFGEMKNILSLDLSHNNFSGELPTSLVMGCSSLTNLKLSQNKFSGRIFPKLTNLTSLGMLDMSNNQFTGKIGDGLLNMSYLLFLDISNNFLTSALPSWMGNFTSLAILSMSNNFLEGTLPVSLYENTELRLLDLSSNMLSGALHSRFRFYPNGLVYLHDNNLIGPITDMVLGNVAILDLRNNKLWGGIPQFFDTQSISVLLLRGNNLTGYIPPKLCDLSKINILDLSYNRLNGSIPSCLNNMSFGSGGDGFPRDYGFGFGYLYDYRLDRYYKSTLSLHQFTLEYFLDMDAEVEFAAKQRYDTYTGGSLGYMFGLDLSSNELNGEIPAELGDLLRIRAVNLSHNSLSGHVPESFSKLKDVESLDLSYNRLYGQIPPQLRRLDSLAFFNVSYNNLSGVIPQGGKFQTLDESNFIGNFLLCGPPTNRSCNVNNSETPYYGRKDDETAIDMVVVYWSSSSTYLGVLIGILVFLCFDSPWRRAWFRLVDAFIHFVRSMWTKIALS